ncbi:hypothetical protein [Shewanella livingstonensis]|uniref:Uncharacterized protein n=1 Tax=Shewanella livingstonensis TaxID=150120 RepID=A0A3G8M0I3_9GAMM|nr:hypothetical protein [Shewanella livingstonensis]AZG74498.1 hypothetical protein EGC82_18115 [Shewanella livingstonensis]
MNRNTCTNLAYYLCQRFYCQPAGRELICLLGMASQKTNHSALVDWIESIDPKTEVPDILWWEHKLKRQLESNGYLY